MHVRTGVIAAAFLLASQIAPVFVPVAASRPAIATTRPPLVAIGDEWIAMSSAGLAQPIRRVVDFDWGEPRRPAAWQRFLQPAPGSAPGAWSASWDRATGVPDRIFGEGLPAPGASTDPAVAAAVARRFLADHLDLL